MRRLVNVLDPPVMSSREAMMSALELIAKAPLPENATADQLRERLNKCAETAAKALLYTRDAYG